MPPKRNDKKTSDTLPPVDPEESSDDVSTPELISPSGTPAAAIAQGPGDLLVTDAASAVTVFPLPASVATGQAQVSTVRAGAAAEADATTSPLTHPAGGGGVDRTLLPLAAENSDDPSLESSRVSRRSDRPRIPVSEYLAQLSDAERDVLRQLLNPSTPPAQPIVAAGGGSLGAQASVGAPSVSAASAEVAAQPSGSSRIPEAPVHPLGNGASGGQLLSQPSSPVFESKLDSLLAREPRIPCPPKARASLIRLDSHGIDGIGLLRPVPPASSAARKDVVVKYAFSDEEVIAKWQSALSDELKSQIRSFIQSKQSSRQISIHVKRLVDKLIWDRSGHTIRSIEEFVALSIDGFLKVTGMAGLSDNLLGSVPRGSSVVLTLDPLPTVFDADSMDLGLVRRTLSAEDWTDAYNVVVPCAEPLILDRSLVPYALGLGLLVFGAAQAFVHLLVGFILEVGEQQGAHWSGRLVHDFKALTDGTLTGLNGDFVPTVAMLIYLKDNQGVAHLHGSRALSLLSFAKVTPRELSGFFKDFYEFSYTPVLSGIDNFRSLIAVANGCNYWKGTAGRNDPSCHFLGEAAVTEVFVTALCLVFVGDHASLNMETAYVIQNFQGKTFSTIQELYLTLKEAESNYQLLASSGPPAGGLRSAHAVSSHGGGSGGQGLQGGKGFKGSKGSIGSQATAPSSLSSSHSSSRGGGSMSSLSSSSSTPVPVPVSGKPEPVKPRCYRDAIGLIIRFFKIPVVVQFLAARVWTLFTFFERVRLPAIDPTLGPEVTVLRILPTATHGVMSWMFNDSTWLPYDDNTKFGPVTRDFLKYAFTVVRNSLDPKNTTFFNAALSSAQPVSSGRASGSGASSSGGPRHHKKPAQVHAASTAPPVPVPLPVSAPTPSLASSGGGAASGSVDISAFVALQASVDSLHHRVQVAELKADKAESILAATEQQHKQQLSQQRLQHLEEKDKLHQRLDQLEGRRAFSPAQGSQGGNVMGSSQSLVPYPHYNRSGGGIQDF